MVVMWFGCGGDGWGDSGGGGKVAGRKQGGDGVDRAMVVMWFDCGGDGWGDSGGGGKVAGRKQGGDGVDQVDQRWIYLFIVLWWWPVTATAVTATTVVAGFQPVVALEKERAEYDVPGALLHRSIEQDMRTTSKRVV
nr:hypothetical protein [Tanacetum cinerariifolium]